MAFSQFPTFKGYTWPIVRSPVQSTIIQTAASGKEYRQGLFAWPRWKWKFDYGYLFYDYSAAWQTQSLAFQAIAGFFNQAQGQLTPWIYLDPFDSTATLMPASWFNGVTWTNVGNGLRVIFNLFKAQQGGPIEQVQVASAGGLQVYLNGVLQGSGFGLNPGPPAYIQFSSPPANLVVVTWSGT